jgi:hypothetical protein
VKRLLSIYSALFLLLLAPALTWAQSREQWGRMTPEEKAQVERNYQRWQSLPPNEQQRLRKEWQYWQNLPPERRQQLRQRFQQFRELPPNEAQQWREKSRERGLSPDEKRALRDRLRPRDERSRQKDRY